MLEIYTRLLTKMAQKVSAKRESTGKWFNNIFDMKMRTMDIGYTKKRHGINQKIVIR